MVHPALRASLTDFSPSLSPPALPTLDINEGALNHLMTIYKELLPQMCGYLTNAGQLDRNRFEVLLSRMGRLEQEVLEERAKVGVGVMSYKTSRKPVARRGTDVFSPARFWRC